eukprot:CAMPEP_0114597606 /NCGR_PEP_ID=MMETSP0125-20121206/19909_1 /TAXON_ID=485358 ORGANISM="Aristerostoma sp., Strain ATCC 50986" /NCGR_SAMPLE_ID=MMETSP0125 /ASSEMBLY_ACC=CAM_ASM_000245 /LENGTH=53 /DNA_ID=CAMNT_0001802371 /DNA_START=236 /DNA_END=397 /DNA_ORIENTATION=+
MVSSEDEMGSQFNFDTKEWQTIVEIDSEEKTVKYQEKRDLLDSFYTNIIGKLI